MKGLPKLSHTQFAVLEALPLCAWMNDVELRKRLAKSREFYAIA